MRRTLHSPSDLACRNPMLAGIILSLAVVCRSSAQTPPPTSLDRPLRLADCLAISEERQPSLVVGRARLAAAESKLAALDTLGITATVTRHDLPIRRQQARLGVEITRADLHRLEVENRYVVTRAYLSVLYARAQQTVVADLVDDLSFLRERIKVAVAKRDRPEWTQTTVDLVTLYVRRTEARKAEADRGVNLALATLREAMGLPPLSCIRVADEPIPQPNVRVCREEIVAAAVSQRGEAITSNVAVEVVELEADAQAHRRTRGLVHTFAAGVDLHARHVPQPIYGEEFRPGGIPLAMPVALAGSRDSRAETAREYGVQAAAVAQKTRNLTALEAEEAYYTWQEWSRKAALYHEAEQIGNRLTGSLRQEFRGALKRVIEGILPESLLAAQARADYNEALFRQAVALAGLERVTGGAFCAGLVTPPAHDGKVSEPTAQPR